MRRWMLFKIIIIIINYVCKIKDKNEQLLRKEITTDN